MINPDNRANIQTFVGLLLESMDVALDDVLAKEDNG